MPETITKQFRYDFTASEIHDLSLELANKTKELGAVIEEKKKADSEFNGRINEIKGTTNFLAVQVSDGYEMRDYECEVEYNKPAQGQKTITRTDTGEVFTEPMTEEDWNLFNQI